MNSSRPYNRTLLQADEFDLVEFVNLTRNLPFKKLNPVLNDHLDEVKKELGQIVNDEFKGFIQLYADIGESGSQEVSALETKLNELNLKLHEISVDVKGDHEDITAVLDQIMDVRRSEILIRKEDELKEELDIFEGLVHAHEIGLSVNFFAKLQAELNYLSGTLSSCADYTERLDGQKEAMMAQLEDATSRALRSASTSEVIMFASFYTVLGRFDDFIQTFIMNITGPFCAKNVTQARLEELLKMSSGKPGLVCFYETILAFMSSAKELWTEPLRTICPKANALSLDLIVKPVLDHIMSALAVIFSPANPDAFQHAYTASDQFLAQTIEQFEQDKQTIEQSKAWKSFQKTWQVNIYFQLRFREIAGRIEESLDIQLPLLNFNTAKRPEISLDEIYQFKIIKVVIRDIWGDSMIIKPLLTKFFKLTLQTCARYVDWLVSIPTEFEGTELGLSTAIIKALQLHHLCEFLKSVLDSFIIPFVRQLGVPADVFSSSVNIFLKTKWTDAHVFLNRAVGTFWCIYLDRFYHTQFKGGYASSNPMLGNIIQALQFVDKPVLEESILKIVTNYSTIGKGFFEASNKSYLNLKRLETVMKAEMSPEDQRKLSEHEKLKSYLTSETGFLADVLKSNGINSNELNSLKDSFL